MLLLSLLPTNVGEHLMYLLNAQLSHLAISIISSAAPLPSSVMLLHPLAGHARLYMN